MAENWTLIEIQFGIYLDLDFPIFTLNNSLDIKLKSKQNTWHKIKNPIKI